MSEVKEILERLGTLEAALDQMVRVGTVTSLNEQAGMVRVEFADADADGAALISYELPVMNQKP